MCQAVRCHQHYWTPWHDPQKGKEQDLTEVTKLEGQISFSTVWQNLRSHRIRNNAIVSSCTCKSERAAERKPALYTQRGSIYHSRLVTGLREKKSDILWTHAQHERGNEDIHDTEEERQFLSGPNNLCRVP